jgi:hypothetical protein
MTTTHALANSPKTFLDRDNWMRAILASGLPDAAARVAMTLALHLHVDTGRCDPPYSILASKSHVSERSAYRLVDLLEHAGWIAIQRTGGRLINRYTLLNPAIAESGLNPAIAESGLARATLPKRKFNPAKSSLQPCHTLADNKRRQAKKEQAGRESMSPDFAARGKKKGTPDERNLFGETESEPRAPRKTQGDRRSATDDDEAFDRFWAAYPRKIAKQAARKAYDKAIKRGIPPDRIRARAELFALERQSEPPKYTPYPASWLNAGRYDDPVPGAPILDQDGNLVAVQQPPPQNGTTGDPVYDSYLEMSAIAYGGKSW